MSDQQEDLERELKKANKSLEKKDDIIKELNEKLNDKNFVPQSINNKKDQQLL